MKPSTLLNPLLDFVFPPICAACSGKLTHPIETPVCETCWEGLERLPEGNDTPPFEKEYAFTRIRALYVFSKTFQTIIHLLKYDQKQSVGKRLGERMAADIPAGYFKDIDLLVPVPVHHTRRRERGYNQAEIIAQALSGKINVPVNAKGLKRRRKTNTQTHLTKGGRRGNIESAFVAKEGFDGKRVMLVDDVYTTGATVNECAQALVEAGAEEVRVLTAARVV